MTPPPTRCRRPRATRNQARLLQAIITYFSGHGSPTFEMVERLDPERIAAEIRGRAEANASNQANAIPVDGPEGGEREEVATSYADRLRVAISLLGL